LFIGNRATLVSNIHREADRVAELRKGDKKIGTTLQGIGPSYASKILRFGLRIGDLVNWETFLTKYETFIEAAKFYYHVEEFDTEAELKQLKELRERLIGGNMIVDSIEFINKAINDPSQRIIAEGANATMLDVDFGTYPFVTSSSTTVGGVCTGLGVPPQRIQTSIGIMKAYTTRVGGGPFPTELNDEVGEHLQKVGHEYGATTGRPRRCGWLDLNVVKYSNKINGYSSINMTKLDVMTGLKPLKVATHYELDGEKLDG
jgi:adenylosuccinate synthase